MSEVVVKGDQDGLVVTLPFEGDNAHAEEALRVHLEEAGTFLKGAEVTLDTGERALTEEELSFLQSLLSEWEIRLTALRGNNDTTRASALALGLELPFIVPFDSVTATQNHVEIPEESYQGLLVRRTLRGGQVVRHPGAVMVLGDVNPGAEIVAGGDVVVWGTLRGVVHAGAMGDEDAVVCALNLAPTQLRIGSRIAVAPEEKGARRLRLMKKLSKGPERARVDNGAIVVERWPGNG